ncbi:hypothetical protein RKD49_000758 [Streptomyces glaucescens]
MPTAWVPIGAPVGMGADRRAGADQVVDGVLVETAADGVPTSRRGASSSDSNLSDVRLGGAARFGTGSWRGGAMRRR